jgi:hypothetical protein
MTKTLLVKKSNFKAFLMRACRDFFTHVRNPKAKTCRPFGSSFYAARCSLQLTPALAKYIRADSQDTMPPKITQNDLEKELRDFLATTQGSGISFEQALLFDENMLNSWFQESKLSIKDRANWLQKIRQFKEDNFSHQSAQTIEGELSSKMLFDALLFVMAFNVPTGVARDQMQEAWDADVNAFAATFELELAHAGNYESILMLMTYLVTTTTGIALIVGFTIFTCLRCAPPSDIVEAEKFYARFKYAYRASYILTYAAVLLTPFTCYELHLVKTSNFAIRRFFYIYGFCVYGLLLLFLVWSSKSAYFWYYEVEEIRGESKVKIMLETRESLKRQQSKSTMEASSPSSKTKPRSPPRSRADTSNIPPKTASPASEQAQPTQRTPRHAKARDALLSA